MVSVFKPSRPKGRPSKRLKGPDLGTPEVQKKRQQWLESTGVKYTYSHAGQKTFDPAFFDGCKLHLLFYKQDLSLEQLQTGLKIRKLYHQCLRSQGIKNRLSSFSGRLGKPKGTAIDYFENPLVEKQWKQVWQQVAKSSHEYNIAIFQLILDNYSNNPLKDTLFFNRDFLKVLRYSLDGIKNLT